MALFQSLEQDMTAALKAQQKPRLDALRFLVSQLRNLKIDLGRDPSDEEVRKTLASEARRRRESIDAYQKGGRQDLVEKEKYQLSIIEEYLPKQLTDEEISALVSQVKAANPGADFGILIRETMKMVAGRAEGGRVTMIIKRLNG